MIDNISNKRIKLVHVNEKIIEGIISGDYSELSKLSIILDNDWPRKDTLDVAKIVSDIYKTSKPSGFEFWIIVDNNTNTAIGDIGFYGKPDKNGNVEIGYGLVKSKRRKGYGLDALCLMMNWLKQIDDVKNINARCLISNIASIKLLDKSGFKIIKTEGEYIF